MNEILDKISHMFLDPMTFNWRFFQFEGPAIIIMPIFILILYRAFMSFVWLYKDARKRRKSGIIAIVFILLTGWPLSFIWWYWLRPPVRQ
jgi:hypothetical protein